MSSPRYLQNGIISFENLKLPEKYLTIPSEERELVCMNIIAKTMEHIISKESDEKKYKFMLNVFVKNEIYYRDVEMFEASQLFLDLQKIVNDILNNRRSRDIQSNSPMSTPTA